MLEPGRLFTGRLALLLCAVVAIAIHGHASDRHPDLDRSQQLLVVTTADWNSVAGFIQRYDRQLPGGPWRKVGNPIAVVIGKAGMGWGYGIIDVPGRTAGDPVKREGDGRTPAGIFRLGLTFGYAAEKPAAWAMPYRPLTPATECIDDPNSTHYNRIVERTNRSKDWNSSELMRSMGTYYQWGAVIEQNPGNKPGEGSCVFLHVSDTTGAGTSGCTAMTEPQLVAVLAWLRPRDNPLIIEMPVAEYRRAARLLKLPPL